jgi:hypothetical protein
MREVISTHMRPRVAKFVRLRAKKMEMSVSSFLERLADMAMEQDEMEEDVPELTRNDILKDLEECSDPKKCIFYDSAEKFLRHIDEVANEVH